MSTPDKDTRNESTRLFSASVALHNFPGFYGSTLEDDIDREEEQFIDYFWEDNERFTDTFPPELVEDVTGAMELDIRDAMWEALRKHTDYGLVKHEMTRAWICSLQKAIRQDCEHPLPMIFETMTSPRFYNFEMDRAFAYVPWTALERVYDYMRKDGRVHHLQTEIEDRHTSCSGFISFYSNDLETWLAHPFRQWDANMLGTLICAYIRAETDGTRDWWMNEVHTRDYEAACYALSHAFDYAAWKASVIEAWEELRRTEADQQALA